MNATGLRPILAEGVNTPVTLRLGRTISTQLSELRRHFEEAGFLEVVVPHLTRNRAVPYRSTFQVSAPELNFSGALRVSANLYLAETAAELKSVYTMGPSFRSSVAPASTPGSQLAEFQLLEAWGEGTLEDARRFAQNLLQRQIKAVLARPGLVSSERARVLESIEFPLRTVTHEEVKQRTGVELSSLTTGAFLRQTVEAFGSAPIFVTHFPEDSDPVNPDIRLDRSRKRLGFALLAPFVAGNLMAAGELETDYSKLSEQAHRSAFMKELERGGGERSQLEWYFRNISRLEGPRFRFTLGFERLTQFLLGADYIQEAVLLPVYAAEATSDGEAAAVAASRVIVIIFDRIIIIADPEPV